MSMFRRCLMMQLAEDIDTHIYAIRTIDNAQLNYQGIIKSNSNNERIYEFELEVGKTYSIFQQSDISGYCRTRGWSTTALDIGGQTYNDSLSTVGCTVAVGGANFNNMSSFIAKAKYLYVYNQSITTSYSNAEIYIDEVIL